MAMSQGPGSRLVSSWGAELKSTYYGRPLIIWTGIDQYSMADVQSVRSALGDRAYLLAASKQVANYERVAGQVDGEAYYWSSADPDSPSTLKKLQDMSTAVHAHNGLWLAPAASGFDGRMLGGTRVVDRKGGETHSHSAQLIHLLQDEQYFLPTLPQSVSRLAREAAAARCQAGHGRASRRLAAACV
jgi:hypothetical protein